MSYSMKKYIKEKLKDSSIYNRLLRIERTQAEILKGLVFNSTISDSEWLKYKSFSPGEWAADFGLLYTLYRVLNGIKPKSIIEFGLGQSSKMVHQYANYFKIEAVTFEHDANWVNFFKEGKDGQYEVNVHLSELEKIMYKDFETITYKDIKKDLEGKKFDLVLVDGPFGSDHYSRTEIIDIAKNNLKSSFCIIMDDTERDGEMETAQEILRVFDSISVAYCWRTYNSSKSHTLICSPDLNFLTSL